jgi:hypothetical protein
MVLNDPICFYTVDTGCVKVIIIMMSHMTYDYILYRSSTDHSQFETQIILLHHLMAIFGAIVAFITGYGIPSLFSVCLLSEISTFFLNYRNMFLPEQQTGLVCLINTVMFFIFFVAIRLILLPYMMILLII